MSEGNGGSNLKKEDDVAKDSNLELKEMFAQFLISGNDN
jgi:hypothetical protein